MRYDPLQGSLGFKGLMYRGADKSLARPGRKQARKHVRDARDFNNIETRAVLFYFLQDKSPKEIHVILTETLACFLPGRAKDLSAPLCNWRRLQMSSSVRWPIKENTRLQCQYVRCLVILNLCHLNSNITLRLNYSLKMA